MKSQLFLGEGNLKLLLILSLTALFCSSAQAMILTENFDGYASGLSTAATDFIGGENNAFDHSIQQLSYSSQPVYWGIVNSELPNKNIKFGQDAFYNSAAMDVITFNLSGGQYIESLQIDYYDDMGGISIELSNENGEEFSFTSGTPRNWNTFDSAVSGLTEITELKIGSYHGSFDNLVINVVTPEPMTMSLLGLGSILLRRRKRK